MEREQYNHWVTQAVVDQISCTLIDAAYEIDQESMINDNSILNMGSTGQATRL